MLQRALDATVLEGAGLLSEIVHHVYAADLMSDVLSFGQPNSILLTGLANQQVVISAHMAEFKGVVFVRGKKPGDTTLRFAHDNHIVLLATDLDMYEACARIASVSRETGEQPLPAPDIPPPSDVLLTNELAIEGSDFANAGAVSTEVKSMLKKIGFDPKFVRRVAIATYEAEMNVVLHALRARTRLSVTPLFVEIVIDDEGKGIPDVDQAMEEGFTTATEDMRRLGFGSGMGLPNIKKNSDELEVTSEVGKGTCLRARFYTRVT